MSSLTVAVTVDGMGTVVEISKWPPTGALEASKFLMHARRYLGELPSARRLPNLRARQMLIDLEILLLEEAK